MTSSGIIILKNQAKNQQKSINLKRYIKNLKIKRQGIWYVQKNSGVSYPKQGNNSCFKIEDKSFWFRHRNNVIAQIIKKYYHQNDGPIFDIGGGNGFVSRKLVEKGFEVVLIEAGQDGAVNACRRNIKNIICSSFYNIKFKENSVASAGLFDVLEHIKNEHDFLKKIHKILKPGGLLFLTLPAYNLLWSDVDVISGHFRRYSIRKICNILKKTRFQIQYKSYFFQWLIMPILLLRVLSSMVFLQGPTKILFERENKFHILPKALKKLFSYLNQNEFRKLKNSTRVPFGASIIVVAKKEIF